ncbi:MAG: hypothetical protein UT55_C0035G0008 [Candidatus Peregrinibacteria bacterium GW2011_GWE2_39_6]|nr:MAG: hypothetical protein UT36_C0005G0080 [Candidatus Peregrinibacteria bacterium GW2011_GWF2_39_17]KKR25640.1 MAG: hypothetical protein UT55_C0035G0008 [Candidatus Peregrinibacteria bacterium GW2011_GWE2_39_6]HCW32915.1 hypothetical protein [Candidatus Peregrinibacteria bacterium]
MASPMHKFTIFTIIFSVTVIFIMADLIINDYWGKDFANENQLQGDAEIPTAFTQTTTAITNETTLPLEGNPTDNTPSNSELEKMDQIATNTTLDATNTPNPAPSAQITTTLLQNLNITSPRLETDNYEGLIYGFWDTQKAFNSYTILRHKIFSEDNYLSTIYEIQTLNEIETFSAYQILYDLAQNSATGTINETNSYGNASFYFNHSTKTNTVFLTFQTKNTIYALEYAPNYHSSMRELIENL